MIKVTREIEVKSSDGVGSLTITVREGKVDICTDLIVALTFEELQSLINTLSEEVR